MREVLWNYGPGVEGGEKKKKTKAAIMLTDNRPVNYLSDNISAGAVWLAINCIVKVALWRGVLERGASPLCVCVFVLFFCIWHNACLWQAT